MGTWLWVNDGKNAKPMCRATNEAITQQHEHFHTMRLTISNRCLSSAPPLGHMERPIALTTALTS